MKFLILLLSLSVAQLFAANPSVTFRTRHITGADMTNVNWTVRGVALANQSNNIVPGFTITNFTGTNFTWATNLIGGANYHVEMFLRVGATTYRAAYTNCIPDEEGAIESADPQYICTGTNTPSSTVAYSQAAANALFAKRTNTPSRWQTNFTTISAVGITNINLRSNLVAGLTNGALTIDSIGGASGNFQGASETLTNLSQTASNNATYVTRLSTLEGATNSFVKTIDTRGHTNSGSVRFNGVTTIGTNQYLELRGQNDLGQDVFSVHWKHYHGLAATSWSLGSGVIWDNPDESGFLIGNALYANSGLDVSILANGSAYVSTPVGLGYANTVTNMLGAIGQSLTGSGNNALMIGHGLTNNVASSFDLGLADRSKLTLSDSNVYFRTRPYLPSLTASRFAYLNAQNTLTNSAFGESSISDLNAATNALLILDAQKQFGSAVLTNLSNTGSNNITKVDVQNGTANALTSTNTTLNGSVTFTNQTQLFTDNLTSNITARAQSFNLTNNGVRVGIGTNDPRRTLDVAGTIVVGAGSVSQPSYAFNNDTNTGFYSSADDVANLTVGAARCIVMAGSLFGFKVDHQLGWYSAGFGAFDTAQGRFGVNTQYFGTATSGNGSVVGSNAVWQGFVAIKTNAAPSGVTIGTTAPDQWFVIKNLAGDQYFIPAWTNH